MPARTAETYDGKPCPNCERTERYASNKRCCFCSRNKALAESRRRARLGNNKKTVERVASSAPEKPNRKGWPSEINEHDERVYRDPIVHLGFANAGRFE